MTQDDAIVLAFKVVEIASVVTIVAFIACYSMWAKWWREAIGRTIVIKDALLIVAFIPSILSIFFHFGRLTSHIAAWIDIAVIGLIAPVMCLRIAVFWKIHRDSKTTDIEMGDG